MSTDILVDSLEKMPNDKSVEDGDVTIQNNNNNDNDTSLRVSIEGNNTLSEDKSAAALNFILP